MTAFDVYDKLFQEYNKKQIMNGFGQKPVSVQTSVQEVSDQLHSCEMQKIMLPSDWNHKNIYKL